jgi:hypothetical protein
MSQFSRQNPELDPGELHDRAADDADQRRKRAREDVGPMWTRLPCRCQATPFEGGWAIEASSFLCEFRHVQGDVVERP